MTRRERLLATLRGEPVDRPAVSFYEIGGWKLSPNQNDFAVYNHPSWRPLVKLAEEKTDLIRMMGVGWTTDTNTELTALTTQKSWREGPSRFTRTTLQAPARTLTSLTRQDTDTWTTWTLEHLLKDADDVKAYLQLPEPKAGTIKASPVLAEEKELGEAGIVMIDTADPICWAAGLFSMEDYTVMALTEPALFHQLLDRCARAIFPQCEAVAKALPGRLWRICGSEYASEPYLPPRLYEEYVVRYTGYMVKVIQQYGGYARIHSHGRLRGILPLIRAMGADGLDPLEPPPQGDMELWEIKKDIGRQTVLFGNLEASDIENLKPADFEKKIAKAVQEGTRGTGRGFVLMPSSCPYGRLITPNTLRNYELMVESVVG